MEPEVVIGIISTAALGFVTVGKILVQRHLRLIDEQAQRVADQERRFAEARMVDHREVMNAIADLERRIAGIEKSIIAAIVGVERTVEARADEQAQRTLTAVQTVKTVLEDRRLSDAIRAVRGTVPREDPETPRPRPGPRPR